MANSCEPWWAKDGEENNLSHNGSKNQDVADETAHTVDSENNWSK